jgi:hypothetical protein
MIQSEFKAYLQQSFFSEEEFRSILISAKFQIPVDKFDRDSLIETITSELWKSSHTPVGQLIRPHSLRDIIGHLSKKLSLPLEPKDQKQDDNEQNNDLDLLDSFTTELLPVQQEISIDDLPNDVRDQLQSSLTQTFLGLGTTSTSFLSRLLGKKVLEILALPLLQWLRLLPKVGPILISIRGAANVVVGLSGPLGIAATLWTVNSMLGPKWDRCIVLLLGIGLLRKVHRQIV